MTLYNATIMITLKLTHWITIKRESEGDIILMSLLIHHKATGTIISHWSHRIKIIWSQKWDEFKRSHILINHSYGYTCDHVWRKKILHRLAIMWEYIDSLMSWTVEHNRCFYKFRNRSENYFLLQKFILSTYYINKFILSNLLIYKI